MTSKNSEKKQWIEQCKRQLRRELHYRMDYGFVYTYKPVLDDAPSRVFDSIKKYKQWCEKNLPRFLGYHRK